MKNSENEQIIGKYFEKLKAAHNIFVRASDAKKDEILDAFEGVFAALEECAVPRYFSESLLVFGKEFVDSFKKPEGFKLEQQVVPSQPTVSRGVSDRPGEDNPLVNIAADLFGGTVRDATPQKVREAALADKYNALVYRSLKGVGDKVKIEVLLEQPGKKDGT